MEEKSFWELLLHYGLFLGGIFQLICILAIVVVPSNKSLHDEDEVLQDKDGKSRKLHGQTTPQSQTRLREKKKRR